MLRWVGGKGKKKGPRIAGALEQGMLSPAVTYATGETPAACAPFGPCVTS
jgi:hypothetical protein